MNNAAKVEAIRVRELSGGKEFVVTRLADTPEPKNKQVLAVDIEGGVASGTLYVVEKGTITGPWEIVQKQTIDTSFFTM